MRILIFSGTVLAVLLGLASAGLAGEASVSAPADTMIVSGMKESLGEYHRMVEPSQDIQEVLRRSPFHLIGRGTGAISDLYVDGFKRADINVTIDGERWTTACPNRMDTRVGQVDLSEIVAVRMSRNGAMLQEGLGGQLNFQRRLPGEEARLRARLIGSGGAALESDLSLSYEQDGKRIGARHRVMDPYVDGDGRTFEEAYGYALAPTTRIFSARGHALHAEGDVYVEYERSEDLLFPFLMMDERTNDLFEVSGSYRGNRIYMNHVHHVMDNALRTSYAMTDMITDAKNTMFGVVGGRYEIYARHWDADNRITPQAMPAMEKLNHMLPDVWRMGVAYQYDLGGRDPWLFLRAGVIHTTVGDDEVEGLLQRVAPDGELSSWSIPMGVRVARQMQLVEDLSLGLSGEFSSDAPGVEQLFIVTDKPGTKPDWLGNPDLKDPLRATVRAALQGGIVQLEVFMTRVWNYPYPVKLSTTDGMIQTYDGVDALMAGTNLFATWEGFTAGVNWNWGEQTENDSPLAEIQPVTFHASYTTPVLPGGLEGMVRFEHALEQTRVDDTLNESQTSDWSRVDLALRVEGDPVDLEIAVDNVLDEAYARHLSYLRNPFASGVPVFDPGRVVRATVTYGF